MLISFVCNSSNIGFECTYRKGVTKEYRFHSKVDECDNVHPFATAPGNKRRLNFLILWYLQRASNGQRSRDFLSYDWCQRHLPSDCPTLGSIFNIFADNCSTSLAFSVFLSGVAIDNVFGSLLLFGVSLSFYVLHADSWHVPVTCIRLSDCVQKYTTYLVAAASRSSLKFKFFSVDIREREWSWQQFVISFIGLSEEA